MYKETLPSTSCPPDTALPMTGMLLRLVANDTVTADDFRSWAAINKRFMAKRECASASCSMVSPAVKPEALKDLLKFPNLKDKIFAACVSIDEDSGVTETKGTHVDLWMYKAFDPVKSTTSVIKVEDYGK